MASNFKKKWLTWLAENIKTWGLENRVTIEHSDVRNYASSQKFDLITLHGNVYYFSVLEREGLFRYLNEKLKPGGQVLLTTVCQGGGPIMQAVNIWVSTTERYGPLPSPDQLCQQFKDAGFAEVKTKRLVPFESFWAFCAIKAHELIEKDQEEHRNAEDRIHQEN